MLKTPPLSALYLSLGLLFAPVAANANDAFWAAVIGQARDIDRLHALLVLHRGQAVLEHVQAGPGLDHPANIKSVSKTVLSALIGLALERGLIDSPDQPLAELLGQRFPERATPGSERITVGHALSLQAGLQSTSGRYYGPWVASENWVAHVLTRPMVDRPGGRMIYSTGPSHLLSAALDVQAGRTVEALARDWLGDLGIALGYWPQDPQGINFGGNDMHISPRDLARLGELYRQGGVLAGRRHLAEDWIERSWTPRGTSPWSGDDYGYGWFITELDGEVAYYGRGFGGQALFVLPSAALTIVMTSDPDPPSPGGVHFRRLKALAAAIRIRMTDAAAQDSNQSSAIQSLGLR